MRILFLTMSVITMLMPVVYAENQPLRIGVVGLTHTHVHWIFESEKRGEITIVGIAESNRDLAMRYAGQHGFSMDLVYPSLESMIDQTHPEAVTAFGTIYEHLSVVEICAPRGIHVMVEKPLAVNLDHAKKMDTLAKKHNIHLLTNYETTWYPSNHLAYEMVKRDTAIGDLRRIIVRDGHKGPAKIGINHEFLEWLTDPVQNGGGASMDFGCYGANLITWLMDGKKPISVTAVTQQLQPENNPKVDDEAIIILQYENAVGIIQASWNWPIGRKDMEIYGLKGVVYADNRHDVRVRLAEGYDGFIEKTMHLPDRQVPYDDPFAFFAAVIKKKAYVQPYDLSSMDNNMIVMEILDAALRSAQSQRTIYLHTK